MLTILLGVVLAGSPTPAPEATSEIRVGRVIIEGNVYTPDREILDELDFLRPGRLLPGEADLLRAEIKLLMAFHKRFDLADRQRPRIEVEADQDSTSGVHPVLMANRGCGCSSSRSIAAIQSNR